MYKKKVALDLGPNPHTAPSTRKEVLTPPRHPPYPHPPPKGVPGYVGLRGQKRKIHRGIIFSPKMMILQGVGHPVPYLGVSYANDPKKGGYMAYAPALDLTTLFEVIARCDSSRDGGLGVVACKLLVALGSFLVNGAKPNTRVNRHTNALHGVRTERAAPCYGIPSQKAIAITCHVTQYISVEVGGSETAVFVLSRKRHLYRGMSNNKEQKKKKKERSLWRLLVHYGRRAKRRRCAGGQGGLSKRHCTNHTQKGSTALFPRALVRL